MAYVCTIFHERIAVKHLILPLHPDKRTSTPATYSDYEMALDILTEIALTALTSNKTGESLDTASAFATTTILVT